MSISKKLAMCYGEGEGAFANFRGLHRRVVLDVLSHVWNSHSIKKRVQFRLLISVKIEMASTRKRRGDRTLIFPGPCVAVEPLKAFRVFAQRPFAPSQDWTRHGGIPTKEIPRTSLCQKGRKPPTRVADIIRWIFYETKLNFGLNPLILGIFS